MPATAVQLAHACLSSGFDLAVPESWGEELIASEALRQLATRGKEPAIFCACPLVVARLLGSGADLAAFLLPLVAPPVAAARYVRALYGANGVRITYVGSCPAGADPSIDERVLPLDFIAALTERGISLADQPKIFESVMPPDRRRWSSIPGGAPSPELLWRECGERAFIDIDSNDVSTEIAERLLANEHAVIDVAAALGCFCSGALSGSAERDARTAVAAMEPPRAPAAVIDAAAAALIELTFPLPSRYEAKQAPRAETSPAVSEGSDESSAEDDEPDTQRRTRDYPEFAAAALAAEPVPGSAEVPLLDLTNSSITSATTAIPVVEPGHVEDVTPVAGAAPAALEIIVTETEDEPGNEPPHADQPLAPNESARDEEVPDFVQSDTVESGGGGSEPSRRRRSHAPTSVRPTSVGVPKARSGDGRALPRAYVARRRNANGARVNGSDTFSSEEAAVPTEPNEDAKARVAPVTLVDPSSHNELELTRAAESQSVQASGEPRPSTRSTELATKQAGSQAAERNAPAQERAEIDRGSNWWIAALLVSVALASFLVASLIG